MKTLNIILTGLLIFGSLATAQEPQQPHNSAQSSRTRAAAPQVPEGTEVFCGKPDGTGGQFAVYPADDGGQRAGLVLYQGKTYALACEKNGEKSYLCSTRTDEGIFFAKTSVLTGWPNNGSAMGSAWIQTPSGDRPVTTMFPCSFGNLAQGQAVSHSVATSSRALAPRAAEATESFSKEIDCQDTTFGELAIWRSNANGKLKANVISNLANIGIQNLSCTNPTRDEYHCLANVVGGVVHADIVRFGDDGGVSARFPGGSAFIQFDNGTQKNLGTFDPCKRPGE